MGFRQKIVSWFTSGTKTELKANTGDSAKQGRKRPTSVIKRITPRQVSYQISDINSAVQLARNPDTPDRSKLFAIYYYIMRDARTKSQVRDAKMKVQSEPYMLYKPGEVADEELSRSYRSRWLNAIIDAIVEAEIWGFSVLELASIDPQKGNIGEVILMPREHISIERQWILIDGTINGAYLPYGEIMQDIDLLEFGRRDDYGLLLEVAYNVIWKFYSRSDWSRANERVGMPILSIIADTTDDKELDAYEDKAANFGSDGYIVGQKGDEVSLIERKNDNMHLTFLEHIKLSNEEIAISVNGQTATTDQKAFVGSSEVQERKFEDLTLARLQNVVDEMNEKVIPYLQAKGFNIPDGYKFDYPALIRERDRKLNGQQTATDPKQQQQEKKNDPKPVEK